MFSFYAALVPVVHQSHLAVSPPGFLGAKLLLQILNQGVLRALDVFVCGAGGGRPRSYGFLQDGLRKAERSSERR